SLAVNGVGTILAALFGSCFPTTLYIGHPGWKQLGARAGYSSLNGLVISAICLTGTVGLISSLVPIQAGVAIVLWIGIIITAQAFQAVPPNHAPAVAIGLFPAIAAWGLNVTMGAFLLAGGKTLQDILTANPLMESNGFLIQGMLIIDRGYILTCMFLSAICAFLIDRQFNRAAGWSAAAALAAFIGLTHSFQVQGNNVDYLFIASTPAPGSWSYQATPIAIGYALCSLTFLLVGRYVKNHPDLKSLDH
ncbi:MAG: NCS2 family permease, partial [Planctomycetaceae bacterium]|nr:NCS2 family permease [Planctomycetaceae bacterium]